MFQCSAKTSSGVPIVIYSNEETRINNYGAVTPVTNMLFDDSVPGVDDTDVCTVSVNGFKIEFFTADYSSLLFNARAARKDGTPIESLVSQILLSKEDAAALVVALESRKDIADAERDFYNTNLELTQDYFRKIASMITPRYCFGQA